METIGTVSDSYTKYSSGNKGRKHHYAVIEYTYKVMGTDFSGTSKIESFWGTEGSAIEHAADHDKGTTLTVRYNPEKPQNYITELDKVSALEVFNVVIFLIVGVSMLIALINGTPLNTGHYTRGGAP